MAVQIVFDSASFRLQYKEFSDETQYPNALIEAYWDMASEFVTVDGSPFAAIQGKGWTVVLNMLTAHIMKLAMAAADSAAQGTPGGQVGFMTSASVGEVSVSTLAPPVKNGWQWWLCQTPYGSALWALLAVKSVGGLVVPGLPERQGFRKIGGVFF